MRFLIFLVLILGVVACGKKEVRNEIPEAQRPLEFLKYGDQLYQNGDYENAFRAYGVIYYNYPTSREYIDAAIGISKCYGALENYDKEFDTLFQLLRENLIPTKVPLVYNSIAQFYERSAGISEEITGEGTTDYQTAMGFFQKSIDYPESKDLNAKAFAQFKIGTLFEKINDYPKAIEAYQTTLNTYQGTEWALRAEQNILDIQAKIQRRADYQQRGLLPTIPDSSDNKNNLEQIDSNLSPELPPDTSSNTNFE